jgi:phosphatidylglycerophosphatase A
MDHSFISSDEVENAAIQALHNRGVQVEDIAQLTYFLQSPYIPNLTMEECAESVKSVLRKREVQNTLLTGIELDMLTEKGKLTAPLQQLIQRDESLYGVDETLALSILNIYGSISFTNYGHIDKLKKGILERLNDKSTGEVHAFLDDLVGAIAAAASSRLAHQYRTELEQNPDMLS